MPTALVPLLYGGDKGWRGWFFLLNPLSQGISFPRFPRMLEVLTRQGAVLPERQGVKAGAHEEQKLYILLVQLCIFPFPSGLSSFSQTISFTALLPILLSMFNSTTQLKLSLEAISFVAPPSDALTLTIDSTAWEATGESGDEGLVYRALQSILRVVSWFSCHN